MMMNDNILLVDDDPGSIQLLGRILSGVGQLRFATSGEEALRIAREAAPDLILLDAEMPGMSGLQVCEALKTEPALADIPVIFVTSHCDNAFEVTALETGAADFIAKPVNGPLVLARVKAQLRAKHIADELRNQCTADILTGVANRRRFDESLEREWLRAQRTADPLALLLIDLDHFKLYNERHGYQIGNACLRGVAQALVMATLRPADFVARNGGQEFALLLPQTPRRSAEHMAHRVLDAVAALAIAFEASPTASRITVSIGIGCCDDATPGREKASAESRIASDAHLHWSASALLQAADKALRSAKQAGRARARLLDMANVETPSLARDILPASHDDHVTALVGV